MSDTQIRFKQLGGGIDWTVPVVDMADYPVEQEVVLERQIDTTWGGKTYTYQKYTKKRWIIHFNDISSDSISTLANLSQQTYDFAVYYGTDVANGTGLYATCYYAGPSWYPRETAYGLWSVDFIVEQTEGGGTGGTALALKHYNGTANLTPATVTFAGTASWFDIQNVDSDGNGILSVSFDSGTKYKQIIGYGGDFSPPASVAITSVMLKGDGTAVEYEIVTAE